MHCHQTQPAPREYLTQYYVVELQSLVELNSNILVRDVERMSNVPVLFECQVCLSCLSIQCACPDPLPASRCSVTGQTESTVEEGPPVMNVMKTVTTEIIHIELEVFD